jgi:hypothetical protein
MVPVTPQPFTNELHEFYCHVFVALNRKWEAQGPRVSIMEFPAIFAGLKADIEKRIDRRVKSTNALFFRAADIFEEPF